MKQLTSQQEKFAQLVASGVAQTDACKLTGIDLCDKPAQAGYYVYFLIDPRTDTIFYVGKGKGSRMFMHGKYANTAKEQNHPKSRRIVEIRNGGVDVQPRVFAHCESEADVLQIERKLIAAWKPTLTNISLGTALRTPRDEVGEFLAHVWKIIRSIKPIEDWVASARDDQLELAAKHPGGVRGLYDEHIGELERIINLQVANFRSRGLTC